MIDPHHEHHDHSADVLIEHAVARLRSAGERVTQARRGMLEVLARNHDHLTADDVAGELVDQGVHRATVFRSLEAFASVGIVTYHQLPGGATTYHLASDSHLHAHCVICHEVVALPPDVFAEATANLLDNTGFMLEPNRSSLVGICRTCAAEKATERAADDDAMDHPDDP